MTEPRRRFRPLVAGLGGLVALAAIGAAGIWNNYRDDLDAATR